MSLPWFKFGDIDSSDYGILVTGASYGVPARDFTAYEIPGRNGNLTIDNGRWKNIDVTYHCEIHDGEAYSFGARFREFVAKIAIQTGYQEIHDSYNEDYYWYGILSSSIVPSAKGTQWSGGEFDITFSCKPQRYLTEYADAYIKVPGLAHGSIAKDGTFTDDTDYVRTSFVGGKTHVITYHSSSTVNRFTFYYVAYDASDNVVGVGGGGVPSGMSITVSNANADHFRFYWKTGNLTASSGNYIEVKSSNMGGYSWYAYDGGTGTLNPTAFEAKPIIIGARSASDVYEGMADLQFAVNDLYVLSTFHRWNHFDCETQQATWDSHDDSISSYVSMNDFSGEGITAAYKFPTFVSGINWFVGVYTCGTYDTPWYYILTPRYWTL